jgi:UDP-N-acetylmuramoyl-L-alanyl-D-glutamate--2,6-diaminopimelate ligase
VVKGVKAAQMGASRYEVIVDRRQAIERAVDIAKPGDVVLIAGKGHETYQQFADHQIHFSDREEARAALEKRMYAGSTD